MPDGRHGLLCYFRDVSDQMQAAASKAYLAAIVDSADDAILSKNLDGIIQSCNAAAEQLFGYSSDELVGRPVRMLIPADRQSEEDDILARLRRGERIDHFETVRLAKGGRAIEISLDDIAGARPTGPDHRRVEDRARHHGHQAGGGRADAPRAGERRGHRDAERRRRDCRVRPRPRQRSCRR